MLRIRIPATDTCVADPECLSRIRIFPSRIPNPGSEDPDPGSGSATLTGTLVHLGEGGMGVAGEKDHPRLTPGVHYSLLEDTTQHK